MAASREPYFTPATFTFLRQLARNNNRAWFEKNRPCYEEDVKGPCLRLIADMAEPLKGISAQLVANPKTVGGSLFRIYRDTRFAADKSPYKTHTGMTFYHAAARSAARGDGGNAGFGRLDAPVLYLHLQPGECFTGGGIWHPQPETLKRVRNYMVNNPASWKKATRDAKFLKVFALGGDALSRPPAGYDPKHELIEDLKRKDFICSARLDESELCAADLPQRLVRRYRLMTPMVDWLCGALDLEF